MLKMRAHIKKTLSLKIKYSQIYSSIYKIFYIIYHRVVKPYDRQYYPWRAFIAARAIPQNVYHNVSAYMRALYVCRPQQDDYATYHCKILFYDLTFNNLIFCSII